MIVTSMEGSTTVTSTIATSELKEVQVNATATNAHNCDKSDSGSVDGSGCGSGNDSCNDSNEANHRKSSFKVSQMTCMHACMMHLPFNAVIELSFYF